MYKMMVPKFGSIHNTFNRRKIVDTWLKSKGYRRSGLNADELRQALMKEASNAGAFMRIVMNRIAESQKAQRWALYDADNALFIEQIKADIPEALFVHIIRDGRDIALSLRKMGGFTPFFWNRKPASLLETAIYWEWIVRKGQEQGWQFLDDYIEVHYEDLVANPRQVLNRLGTFLDHDLDYDRIRSAGLGRLSETNSSFLGEETQKTPVNRWKAALSSEEIAQIELQIGGYLKELNYPLTSSENPEIGQGARKLKQMAYASFLDAKLWTKLNTPLGRLISIAPLELEADAQPRLA